MHVHVHVHLKKRNHVMYCGKTENTPALWCMYNMAHAIICLMFILVKNNRKPIRLRCAKNTKLARVVWFRGHHVIDLSESVLLFVGIFHNVAVRIATSMRTNERMMTKALLY